MKDEELKLDVLNVMQLIQSEHEEDTKEKERNNATMNATARRINLKQ